MTETTPGPVVLLVEDEPQMRRFLRASLASNGYRLVEAATATEARQLGPTAGPELILLDLGLPDGDGLQLIPWFREWTSAPIIVISARGREDDKVKALDGGGDDYLTKPFGVQELMARMRVALRHASRNSNFAPEPRIEVGPLVIDLPRHDVRLAGNKIGLTPIEFKLLVVLARNAGKVLTQRQLLREVWGAGHTALPHHLRVHMAGLRRKLEPEPARPVLILTEPGVGYRLAEAAEGTANARTD